jgi:hypothetical protein
MPVGPSGAIIVFPSGTDVYSAKVDRFVIISGESHVIPTSPYQFFLGHLPLQTGPSNVSIPGYLEVAGTPASFQYNLVYSGNNAGLTTFNSAQSTFPVNVTYTSAGDLVKSEFINSLQTSITNIETYVLSNNPTSGVVHTSGGTMTGNLTMNGASVITSVSGGNTVGLSGLPFSEAYANTFFGQKLQSNSSNYVQFDANGLKQKAETIRLEAGTDIYLTTSGSTIYLYATTISVSGNIIPTFTGFYNLGSAARHFNTLYVDNIVTPNGSGTFVHTSGDSMTGNLTMNGASVVTDQIDANTGTIDINGALVNLNSTSDINLLPSAFGQVNAANVLSIAAFAVSTAAPLVPTISSTYDLGASGNTFRTLYVDEIIGATLSGSFVRTSGDTMTGDLTIQPPAVLNVATINSVVGSGVIINAPQINMNASSDVLFTVANVIKLELGTGQIYHNASVIPTASGTYDLGAPDSYIDTVYANNIKAGKIIDTILVNPSLSGTIALASGSSFITDGSGSITFGSPSSPLGTIYATNVVTSVTSGTYVSKYGDTMTGNLNFASGAGITTSTSGTSDVGSASNPFGTIYANNFTLPSGGALFVLKTGDTMTGPLLLNDLRTPSGSMTISGTVNTNILANTAINLTAPTINITSTVGPVIFDGNTELQFLHNGTLTLDINPSGAVLYESMLPVISGTLTLGTASHPFNTIYANNLVGLASSGNFVSRTGDSMTGNLTMSGNTAVVTNNITSNGQLLTINGITSGLSIVSSSNNIDVAGDKILLDGSSGEYVLVSGSTVTMALGGTPNMIGSNTQTTFYKDVYFVSGSDIFGGTGDNFTIGTTGAGQNIILNASSGVQLTAGGTGDITLNGSGGDIILQGGGGNIELLAGGGPIILNGAGDGVFIDGSGGPVGISGNGIQIKTNSSLDIDIDGGTGSADVRILGSAAGEVLISGNSSGGIRTSSNIFPLASGTDSIGSASRPYGTLYTNTISGASFASNILLSSSGTINIGSPANPVKNIYAQQLIQPVKTITGSYTVASGDAYVLANHSSAIIVGLPLFEQGYRINFKDQSGLANPSTRLITISGISCQLDGSSTFAIDTNYGRASFIATSGAWFRIE